MEKNLFLNFCLVNWLCLKTCHFFSGSRGQHCSGGRQYSVRRRHNSRAGRLRRHRGGRVTHYDRGRFAPDAEPGRGHKPHHQHGRGRGPKHLRHPGRTASQRPGTAGQLGGPAARSGGSGGTAG